jgi:hypothetical protein
MGTHLGGQLYVGDGSGMVELLINLLKSSALNFLQLIIYHYATFSCLFVAWDVASHDEFHGKKTARDSLSTITGPDISFSTLNELSDRREMELVGFVIYYRSTDSSPSI